MSKSLTDKQQAFVREYLVDLNATQAAVRAGYSEKTASEIGHENLRKPQIEMALADAFEQRAERVQLDQDTVIRGLLEEARYRGTGASHSARVQAWTTLARHLGMLTDRMDLRVDQVDRLRGRSVEELEAIAAMSDDELHERGLLADVS